MNDLLPTACGIPAELRTADRWIVWRSVPDSTGGKPRKQPIRAGWPNPPAWSSFADALATARTLSGGGYGVGFVLSRDAGLAFIDLDGCLGDDATPAPWAAEILARFHGAWVERSIGGRGLHLVMRGTLERDGHNFGNGIECYTAGRWCAVTGRPFGALPEALPDHGPELLKFEAEQVAAHAARKAPARTATAPPRDGAKSWAAAALRAEIGAVADAANGCRNDQLNRSAFSLGQLVAGGELDRATVEAELLYAASAAGLGDAEARATIASGMHAAEGAPRRRPEPPASLPEAPPPPDAPTTGLVPLAIISPADVLALELPDDDNLVGDRILAHGQMMALLAAPGIGKSKALRRLAVNLITGRDWLGLPTFGRNARVLLFCLEDSPRRLQTEFAAMRATMAPADWEHVNAQLRILNPLADGDRFLSFGDALALARMAAAIEDFKPDVIGFDPLVEFYAGDSENDAQQMRDACVAMMRLARASGPDTAVVVVHHARTGREGARAAVGYDRGSFGRGSKALLGFARATINLAPGSPDDPDLLVVSCGKSNNGKQFHPRAVRFDPREWEFHLQSGFNFDAWEQDLSGARPTGARIADADVFAAIKPGERIDKRALVQRVMDETGFGKSATYRRICIMLKTKVIVEDREGRIGRP